MLLAAYRERSGLTLSELARRTKMKKTALSRLENHGEDVRLSTISRYVQATGKPLSLIIIPLPLGKRRSGGRVDSKIELVPSQESVAGHSGGIATTRTTGILWVRPQLTPPRRLSLTEVNGRKRTLPRFAVDKCSPWFV